MKKTLGIILALAIIVILVAVFTSRGGDKVAFEEGTMSGKSEVVTGTFGDLASLGKNFQCSFESDEEVGTISGTMYVADEKIRGSYTLLDPEGSISNFEYLRDDSFNYFWGESPYGGIAIKTRIDEEDATVSEEVETFDASEQEFDFECHKWSPQESMFDVPTDVEFNTFMIPDFDGNTSDSIDFGLCSACNALEGDAKASCLEGLAQFGC